MVQGEVKDCGCPHHPLGGLARRAKYVADLWVGGKTLVQVDAGDGFFAYVGGNVMASPNDQEKAKVMARSLQRMKVDALNVGQLDLAGGLDFLQKQLGSTHSLPLLSSNLFDKQKQEFAFPRQEVIERNGLRIGIFGLIQTPPPYLADRLEARDPVAAAQEVVSELRGKSDLVIGLVSLEFNSAAQLAQQVPGIDVLVSSRGGRTTPQPFLAESTLVVQAGNRGKYLGRMDLTMQPGGYNPQAFKEREQVNRELERLLAQRRILEGPQLQTDPQVKAKYDELAKQTTELTQKLEALAGGFENKNSMVDMALSMPEDPQIAEWVAALLKPTQPPAPPAPAAPSPAPAGP
jgi:2',3'-cyclic-nucleotide 2'-phosphodiesterase (5'-nucleotidase family)